jgi:hypothetical protein
VKEGVQDVVRCVGIETMTAALEIFASVKELAAQGEPVQVLLVRQVSRGNGLKRSQGSTAPVFLFLLELKAGRSQLAFPVAEADHRGVGRIVLKDALKIFGEQSFKSALSFVHIQARASG